MNLKNLESVNATAAIVFVLGCIGLAAVMLLDRLYWGNGVFAEGRPDLSPGHIGRSIIIFISILAMFLSLIGNSRPKLRFDENSEVPLEQLSIVGVLSI